MNTKFKFGDRVYFPSNVEEIGIVIQVLNRENKIVVAWNDGEQTTEAIDDMQLTIIPHPDTVRLDWLENNQFELGTYYHDDGLGFTDLRHVVYQPDKDGCRIKLSDEKSYRQAIDNAMQQEQTK